MATPRGEFLSDIETLRRRAREHVEEGALTRGYTADHGTVLRLLNEALATEVACVRRHERHHDMANGIHAPAVAAEFLQHASEEQEHAKDLVDLLATLDPTKPA